MKTDTQLQQDVMAELKWEPSVSAADIGVEVKEGIVTLAGQVRSYGEKLGAERAAKRVSGVKGLAIAMNVDLPGFGQRTDADIAHAAENNLEWMSCLPKDSVMVENGWITLSGEVDWNFQRDTAAAAVRHLMGVTGVSDQITLRATVSSSDVKSEIEAALKRRASADAQKIIVNVQGADVTLSGTVTTWSERDLAVHSAWGTPGVRHVVDNLAVSY